MVVGVMQSSSQYLQDYKKSWKLEVFQNDSQKR